MERFFQITLRREVEGKVSMGFWSDRETRDRVVMRGRWQFEQIEMTVDLVTLDRREIERRFANCGHLDAYPAPTDQDGPFYCLLQNGDPLGPCFLDPDSARAWADNQPWAPVEWDVAQRG